jgi:hypothetical protein
MFHTIIVKSRSGIGSVQHKPPEFLHRHVKRVLVRYSAISLDVASRILPVCTGIMDLALWFLWPNPTENVVSGIDDTKASIMDALARLPLRYLEIPYEILQDMDQRPLRPGWCTSITHLDMYTALQPADPRYVVRVPMFQHLHALTHLCLGWSLFEPEVHETQCIASFLEMRPTLRVVLVDTQDFPNAPIPGDARIVYRHSGGMDLVKEWEGRGSGVCKWIWAEEQVARQKRGSEESTKP